MQTPGPRHARSTPLSSPVLTQPLAGEPRSLPQLPGTALLLRTVPPRPKRRQLPRRVGVTLKEQWPPGTPKLQYFPLCRPDTCSLPASPFPGAQGGITGSVSPHSQRLNTPTKHQPLQKRPKRGAAPGAVPAAPASAGAGGGRSPLPAGRGGSMPVVFINQDNRWSCEPASPRASLSGSPRQHCRYIIFCLGTCKYSLTYFEIFIFLSPFLSPPPDSKAEKQSFTSAPVGQTCSANLGGWDWYPSAFLYIFYK